MKKILKTALILTITAGSMGIASGAIARPQGPKMPAFAELDTNGDGAITQQEVAALKAAKFAEHDTNGDGFLDVGELQAAAATRGERGDGRGEGKAFEHMDADSDGMLTKDEAKGPLAWRFDKLDANGDGMLDMAELESAASMRGNHGNPEDRVQKMLERADTNSDGMLSLEEAGPKDSGGLFEKADANGDGSITQEEWDAAREKMRGHGRNNG